MKLFFGQNTHTDTNNNPNTHTQLYTRTHTVRENVGRDHKPSIHREDKRRTKFAYYSKILYCTEVGHSQMDSG